jgi:hypothetical protein
VLLKKINEDIVMSAIRPVFSPFTQGPIWTQQGTRVTGKVVLALEIRSKSDDRDRPAVCGSANCVGPLGQVFWHAMTMTARVKLYMGGP